MREREISFGTISIKGGGGAELIRNDTPWRGGGGGGGGFISYSMIL